jgi:transcriptional regulator CtsR
MSDLVTQVILQMLEEQDGSAEIQRNELAGSLGCVPSQINYVITSRFTPEQGYIVESRRGGGGYIRISRVKMDKGTALMHIVNSVGDSLDKATAEVMLRNMLQRSMLQMETAKAIAAALSDRTLQKVEQERRDAVRADLFKNMLLTLDSKVYESER